MTSVTDKYNLQDFTRKMLRRYLKQLDGHQARKLYDIFINEAEKGIILEVMEFTKNNHTKCSEILGITRTTLRNKIRKHKL
ncbi:MAG: helix-turn-helix domain-containing protein [Gammaproteobacteria bacterium]|jgi:Fis family transcriptional regulator